MKNRNRTFAGDLTKTVIIYLFLSIIVALIIINKPHRIGQTSYYLIWINDDRCLAFRDPNTREFSSIRGLTCNEVYYNNNYILAYDVYEKFYYIIQISKEPDEKPLIFKNMSSFKRALDSLQISISELKYSRAINYNEKK